MTTFECLDNITVSIPTTNRKQRIKVKLYSLTLLYLLEQIKATGEGAEFIRKFLTNYTKDVRTINIVTAELTAAELA